MILRVTALTKGKLVIIATIIQCRDHLLISQIPVSLFRIQVAGTILQGDAQRLLR